MGKVISSEAFRQYYVKKGRILPNDFTMVRGDLKLSGGTLKGNFIQKIENLPEIAGKLSLDGNNITIIENLPIVHKPNIRLDNNPIQEIRHLEYTTQISLYLTDIWELIKLKFPDSNLSHFDRIWKYYVFTKNLNSIIEYIEENNF